MDGSDAKEFWDERAREDAYFFVDDRRSYRDPMPGSFWEQGERDLDRLLASVSAEIEAADTVLDLGCGVGRLTRAIAQRANQVYALDVSSEMVRRAQLANPCLGNVQWLIGDGRTLRPLRDASVDACVSHVVFQHIPDPQVTLGYVAEMGRVLRPEGWAAFQISNDASVHARRRGIRTTYRRLAARAGRAPRGQDDPAWLGSAIALSELEDVAARCALELEQVVGAGTQFCVIRLRKQPQAPPRPAG